MTLQQCFIQVDWLIILDKKDSRKYGKNGNERDLIYALNLQCIPKEGKKGQNLAKGHSMCYCFLMNSTQRTRWVNVQAFAMKSAVDENMFLAALQTISLHTLYVLEQPTTSSNKVQH
ncbi:hypothetical protein RIF29_21118 [Crotalaria pallida]|uniref:Uncharacterized protein n=1 Tax=Crotalaria pallida TaxID=3830 RepID=A0AAN9I983_CROPI